MSRDAEQQTIDAMSPEQAQMFYKCPVCNATALQRVHFNIQDESHVDTGNISPTSSVRPPVVYNAGHTWWQRLWGSCQLTCAHAHQHCKQCGYERVWTL